MEKEKGAAEFGLLMGLNWTTLKEMKKLHTPHGEAQKQQRKRGTEAAIAWGLP